MGGAFARLAAALIVNLGGGDVAVAEQLLDLAQIGAAIEQGGGGGHTGEGEAEIDAGRVAKSRKRAWKWPTPGGFPLGVVCQRCRRLRRQTSERNGRASTVTESCLRVGYRQGQPVEVADA